jgi:hypothetical protein
MFLMIPNKDIHSFFSSGVIQEWIERSQNQKHMDRIFFELSNFIEIKEKYEETLNNGLLKNWTTAERESDFMVALNSTPLHQPLSARHECKTEVIINACGRADAIFYPIEGQSGTVIIQEYKADRKGNPTALMDEAITQIFERKYMHNPLNMFRHSKEFKHWKFIIARAVVFTKTNGWIATIKEFKFSIDEAIKVVDHFSTFPFIPSIKTFIMLEKIINEVLGKKEEASKNLNAESYVSKKNKSSKNKKKNKKGESGGLAKADEKVNHSQRSSSLLIELPQKRFSKDKETEEHQDE